MSRYIIDSFALLASYWGEPDAAQVQQIFADRSNRCWMSVINVGEAFYRIVKEESVQSAEQALIWLAKLPISVLDADFDLAMEAARIKGNYPIAYADCFAAALARRLDARVVTGDPEFERLESDGVVGIEWLRRRRRGR